MLHLCSRSRQQAEEKKAKEKRKLDVSNALSQKKSKNNGAVEDEAMVGSCRGLEELINVQVGVEPARDSGASRRLDE